MTDDMDADTFNTQLANLEREETELKARLDHPGALAAAALWFARAGNPIFPLHNPVDLTNDPVDGSPRFACSCGQPCASPAKHPRTRNGLKDATTDPDTIAAWWRRWPSANIGLVTGVIYDVIDLDGPAGSLSFAELRHAKCPPTCCDTIICPGDGLTIPPTYGRAVTPRGRHIYVAAVEGAGNKTALLPGVDYRGGSGYVVAPPSRGMTGHRYFFVDALTDPRGEA